MRDFVVVIHHNVVESSLRFLNLFSGPVNRDLVFLGRLRVFGQLRYGYLPQPVSGCVLRLASGVSDHFEHVVGVLLGVDLRFQRTGSATMEEFNEQAPLPCKCLSLVCGPWSPMVRLCGAGAPWVLTRTHQRAVTSTVM